MNFQQRYKDSQTLKELDRLFTSIAKARPDFRLTDPEQRIEYSRFLRAVRYAKRQLLNTDPSLVTATALTQLQKTIAALASQHDAFLSDKNWESLANQTDAMLDQLYRLPRLSALPTTVEMAESLRDFRSDAETELQEIKSQLSAALQELRHGYEALKQQSSQFKQQLDQEQQQFEQQKGRLDKLINDESTRFNDAEQQRLSKFTQAEQGRQTATETAIATMQEDTDKAIKAGDKKLTALCDEQRERGKDIITDLGAKLEDAKRIVGLIGNTGMAGHYQIVANAERRSANRLRGVALGFFILMAAGVAWVVHEVSTPDFSWQVALFRVAVAITLAAPAWYCASESRKHRVIEQRNRRIELELASITPYLGTLPNDKSQAVIEQLAAQYFGNGGASPNPDDGDSHLLKDISLRGDQVLRLIERLVKIAK